MNREFTRASVNDESINTRAHILGYIVDNASKVN